MDYSNNRINAQISFPEATNNNSLGNENQWPGSRRDFMQKENAEYYGERPPFKRRESRFDQDFKTYRDEQPVFQTGQQSSRFLSYASTDQLHVNKNQSTVSMMSCNTKRADNNPWPVNSFDNVAMNKPNIAVNQPLMSMATDVDKVQASTSIVNPNPWLSQEKNNSGENIYGIGIKSNDPYGGVPTAESMFPPPVKDIIQLSKAVFYPPNPNLPRPTTRNRPLGCKTVFVGGLPRKVTEEIIREIFERCGPIESIRQSKYTFCHIRFFDESSVTNAIAFSGYILKIENRNETPFASTLHVDYAQNRDDQRDYEIKQRALERQARHENKYRPRTPPIISYTEKEASSICEKLKEENTFIQAADVLTKWLEKGECTKKTAGSFYSMIQSTHFHVRKLQIDIAKYEDQLNEAKKIFKTQLESAIRQFTEIEKIYKAACLQKCWDQFTKAQRKNIELWKKQTEEIKNAHLDEVISEREDEEMELSDDDDDKNKDKSNPDIEKLKKKYDEEIHKYQEEADSLKCQLETAQNENLVMQCQLSTMRQALQKKSKDEKELRALLCLIVEKNPDCVQELKKDNNSYLRALENINQEDNQKYKEEIDALKYRLEALQKEISDMQSDHEKVVKEKDNELETLRQASQKAKEEEVSSSPKKCKDENESEESCAKRRKIEENSDCFKKELVYEDNRYTREDEKETRLVGLISIFLHTHPFGANIDYICSYLQPVEKTVRRCDVESLLKKYPMIFQEIPSSIGSSLGNKWHFAGFKYSNYNFK